MLLLWVLAVTAVHYSSHFLCCCCKLLVHHVYNFVIISGKGSMIYIVNTAKKKSILISGPETAS